MAFITVPILYDSCSGASVLTYNLYIIGNYIFNDPNIDIARSVGENVSHIRYGIGSLGASRNAYATEDDRISAARRTELARRRESGVAATKLNIQKRPSAVRLPNTA